MQGGLTDLEENFGVGAKNVIALCKSIRCPEQKIVCSDNYFTGVPLLVYLKRQINLLPIRTVHINMLDMLQNPPLKGDKDLTICVAVSRTMLWLCGGWITELLLWRCGVNFCWCWWSTTEKCLKVVKKSKKQLEVQCPRTVAEYNKIMYGRSR